MRGLLDQLEVKTLAAVVAAGSLALGANAVVMYGDFDAADVMYLDVEEASADPIEDPEPLYGAPSILPANMLDFNPSAQAFAATSPPPDNTDGSLRFTLMSKTNAPLPGIIVSESGDYQFLGATSGGEAVAGTLFVRVLDPLTNATLAQGTASFFEVFDNVPVEGGFWDNTVSIDLSALNVTKVDVVINNLLQATGSGSATAFIRKKAFKVDVPEPGTAALALAGTGLMLLGRRKSA